MAVPFDAQASPSIKFLVRKNDVNERQVASPGILQCVKRVNVQLRRRPLHETNLARFFQDLVAGSQRHGAAGGAKQKDHNRDYCTKRARRDAGQDDKILAVRAENRKGKMGTR